jgi:hypothetical protein
MKVFAGYHQLTRNNLKLYFFLQQIRLIDMFTLQTLKWQNDVLVLSRIVLYFVIMRRMIRQHLYQYSLTCVQCSNTDHDGLLYHMPAIIYDWKVCLD